jgi:phage baseplate assembly protein W|tara:strand:+ start:1147 stop:1587 length:441 start_codon:yes stop_codon:yes gene_type:complete
MPTKGSVNYDASITNEKRSVRIFKDLNLNFAPNLVTNDVSKLTDIEAIKRSVRNLVQLNHYEKPFHPEIGSNIRATLFENLSPITAALLSRNIETVIKTYESRVELSNIKAIPNIDRNAYDVRIEFFVVNSPGELVTLDVLLERVR